MLMYVGDGQVLTTKTLVETGMLRFPVNSMPRAVLQNEQSKNNVVAADSIGCLALISLAYLWRLFIYVLDFVYTFRELQHLEIVGIEITEQLQTFPNFTL